MNMIPQMSRRRWSGVAIYSALIQFSATQLAGNSAHFAFLYYSDLLGMTGPNTGLHFMAQKCIHFLLFFGLGSWLTNGIKGSWGTRCGWAIFLCLIVGTGSEYLESFFPGRNPAVFDVMLNAFSGFLGSIVIRSEHFSRKTPLMS